MGSGLAECRIAGECGFHWWQARQLTELLELGLELGRLEEGEEAGREALRVSTAIEDPLNTLWTLAGFARVALTRGELERAGRIWGAVMSEERTVLSTPGFGEFAAPLAGMTEPAFLSGLAVGRDDGLEAAVELALAT